MRRIEYLWAAIVALFIVGMAAYSPSVKQDRMVQFEDESGNVSTAAFAGSAQQKIFALDTLTTAGTYTTLVPWNLSSAYQYQYFFQMRKIGVTPNIKVVLDERNTANSNVWSAIDSFSMSGTDSTKLNFRLRGTNTYGSFHRIRFVKTGNGAVSRRIEFNIKPTN